MLVTWYASGPVRVPPRSTVAPAGTGVGGALGALNVTVPPASPPFSATVRVPAVAEVTVPVTWKVWPTAGGFPVHDRIVGTAAAGADTAPPPTHGSGCGAA